MGVSSRVWFWKELFQTSKVCDDLAACEVVDVYVLQTPFYSPRKLSFSHLVPPVLLPRLGSHLIRANKPNVLFCNTIHKYTHFRPPYRFHHGILDPMESVLSTLMSKGHCEFFKVPDDGSHCFEPLDS